MSSLDQLLYGMLEKSELYLADDMLTHCSRETRKRANSADPDQTPQNAASDQGLHCLQIV